MYGIHSKVPVPPPPPVMTTNIMFNHFTNILTECGLLKKITSFCFIRQIYRTVNVIVSRLFPGDLKTWKWLSNS